MFVADKTYLAGGFSGGVGAPEPGGLACPFFPVPDCTGLILTTLPLLLQGLSDQTIWPSTSHLNTAVCAVAVKGIAKTVSRTAKEIFMMLIGSLYCHYYKS